MSAPSADSRKLLAALREGAPPPAEIEPAAWQMARGLLDRLDSAGAEAVALPPALVLALLEASVQAKSVGLADHLARLGGPLAKEARRALYRLRSSGVELTAEPAPAPARAASSASSASRELGDEVPSLVSPYLGNGERALVVARATGGVVTTYEVVVSDVMGVLHFSGGDMSRGNYRKHLKLVRAETRPDQPRSVVEIDFAEAKRILAEAAGRNQTSRTPFPPGLDVALRRLELTPLEHLGPLPPVETDDARLAQDGARLHAEPELERWLPPELEMRQLAQAVDALATSPIQLNALQRKDALAQRIEQAAEAFFTPENRALYGRRLWEIALHFDRTERPEASARARAEARRLFHGASAAPSPFARVLFEKVLRLSGADALAELEEAAPAQAAVPPEPSKLIL